MKGGVSIRTVIILVILVLVGVLGVLGMNTVKTYMSGAAGGEEPTGVLIKRSEDGKSVTITWATDKDTQGVVEYGTTPASLLLRKSEAEMSSTHSLTIDSLVADKPYYFRFRIGEEIYDNNGIPYSIKQSAEAIVEAEPTTIEAVPTQVAAMPTVAQEANSCTQKVDRNGDGVINGVDIAICMKNRTSGGTAETAPTGSATTTDPCKQHEADANNDGRISGAEYALCRQKAQ
jgi:hypothetical protein